MMIIMHPGATKEQIAHVIAHIEENNLSAHVIEGVEQTVIGAVGESHAVPMEVFETLPGVLSVTRISQPYKLASRQFHPHDSVFPLDGFSVGGDEIAIIAGPCSVEGRTQLLEIALKESPYDDYYAPRRDQRTACACHCPHRRK